MNILVIEDEKHISNLLVSIIELNTDCLVVQRLQSVETSISYLQKNQSKIDLIFLDIQLEDGLSFEIFEHVDVMVPVIFCTAYNQYMLEAFKTNGIDYILKPFSDEQIQSAILKCKKITNHAINKLVISNINLALNESSKQYQKSFLIRFQDKMTPLLIDTISLVSIENEIVFAYDFDGKRYVINKKLDDIMAVIDPSKFFRINRQEIVNRAAIKDISQYFDRKVVVHLPFTLPEKQIVSRLKVAEFLFWVEQ